MKLISCLLFLFLIEMHNARRNSTPPNVIRIPLRRVHPKTRKSHSAQARSQITLDTSYNYNLATISFGTPKQNVIVTFDTGSPYTWVLSKKYHSSDPNSKFVYEKHHTYNPDASSTYESPIELEPELHYYKNRWVFGFWANDIITIGNNEIRTNFTEIRRAHQNFTVSTPRIDGRVGLQYNPTDGNIVTKICDKMKQEHTFSIYLPPFKNSTAGEVILCGEDTAKYENGHNLKYVDEINPGGWRVKLDSVTMEESGDPLFISMRTEAQIDTQALYISGPRANITFYRDKIIKHLRGNPDNLQVKCEHVHLLPSLVFKFNENSFPLSGQEYTSELTSDSDLCQILLNVNSADEWLIGDPFLKRYVTVYDMKNHKIGMVRSKG